MIPEYINKFLDKYNMFKLSPYNGHSFKLVGTYCGTLSSIEYGDVSVDYEIELEINASFPLSLPTVTETSNKIEKIADNHINYDGTLCLGSPIRLHMLMKNRLSLIYFFEEAVLPYLYAVTQKLKNGQSFVYGELPHGKIGLLSDFQDLFNLQTKKQIIEMLKILSSNKKIGNKSICPCGCEKRTSTCGYFKTVQKFRRKVDRVKWEEQLNLLM